MAQLTQFNDFFFIVSGTSQWKTARKLILDQTIYTTRVTHGGRHAGAMEAEALDIPLLYD